MVRNICSLLVVSVHNHTVHNHQVGLYLGPNYKVGGCMSVEWQTGGKGMSHRLLSFAGGIEPFDVRLILTIDPSLHSKPLVCYQGTAVSSYRLQSTTVLLFFPDKHKFCSADSTTKIPYLPTFMFFLSLPVQRVMWMLYRGSSSANIPLPPVCHSTDTFHAATYLIIMT